MTFRPSPGGLLFEDDAHLPRIFKSSVRTASIKGPDDETVFEQPDVEAPECWSQRAVNVVMQKYARGSLDKMEDREGSIYAIVDRVVREVGARGVKNGTLHVDTQEEFETALRTILIGQYASFNSPVWFNVGIEEKPQCSACFILSVKDDMGEIAKLCAAEMMIYKFGSGTGKNVSPLRSSKEYVQHGGLASGPCSFEKGYDRFASVIQSGGKTRRAAKMVILNADHPDIFYFVRMKTEEHKKAHVLIDAGYDSSLNGEAWSSVAYQQMNASVGATDAFMRAAVSCKQGANWPLREVTTGETIEWVSASELLDEMAKNAHQTGCPGIMFLDRMNEWSTVRGHEEIVATNPCAEYVFINDSACNLASLNLMKFLREDMTFDWARFEFVCRVMFTAQEILVDMAGYPTPEIEKNSHDFRPLGLGFSNLGALLMVSGYPYDSAGARKTAKDITAFMTAVAYHQSAVMAEQLGPFPAWDKVSDSTIRVLTKHRAAAAGCDRAAKVWDVVISMAETNGVRNAQATLLAPTGTISFMMDCDTTGIEPDIALVKYKVLAGGGSMAIKNRCVRAALEGMGYDEKRVERILEEVENERPIGDLLSPEDLRVFDCAFTNPDGRSISPMGHIRMMAAVQPHLSGAISKTVNVPEETTWEEIRGIYVEAWKAKLKNVAVYRDRCRPDQPVNTKKTETQSQSEPTKKAPDADGVGGLYRGDREELPDERDNAVIQKFRVGDVRGYFIVGHFDDDQTRPAEIFITMAKNGSALRGWADSFAVVFSLALQYGAPIEALANRMMDETFAPMGITNLDYIPIAHSIVDLIARWFIHRYVSKDVAPPPTVLEGDESVLTASDEEERSSDMPLVKNGRTGFCDTCGGITYPRGRCMVCESCGDSSGCS